LDRRGAILHATARAMGAIRDNRLGTDRDAPTRMLKSIPFENWPAKLKELLPNASFDLVKNGGAGIGAIGLLHSRRRASNPDRDAHKATAAFVDAAEPGQPSLGNAAPSQRFSGKALSPSPGFVAQDQGVRAIVRRVENAAARGMPILVRGETGTGK